MNNFHAERALNKTVLRREIYQIKNKILQIYLFNFESNFELLPREACS